MLQVSSRFENTKFTLPLACGLFGLIFLLDYLTAESIGADRSADHHWIQQVAVKAVDASCIQSPAACSTEMDRLIVGKPTSFHQVVVPDFIPGQHEANYALAAQPLADQLINHITAGKPYVVGVPLPSQLIVANENTNSGDIKELHFVDSFSGSLCFLGQCPGYGGSGLVGSVMLVNRAETELAKEVTWAWFLSQDSRGQPTEESFLSPAPNNYLPHFSFWAGLVVSGDDRLTSYLNHKINRDRLISVFKQFGVMLTLAFLLVFLITDLVYGPPRAENPQMRDVHVIFNMFGVLIGLMAGFALIYWTVWIEGHVALGTTTITATLGAHFLYRIWKSRPSEISTQDDTDEGRPEEAKVVRLRSVNGGHHQA